MNRLGWLVFGAALGFVAAHFVNQTPRGREFFARVNRGVDELGSAFVAGYNDFESEQSKESETASLPDGSRA